MTMMRRVDLLPQTYAARRRERRTTFVMGLVALVVVALIVLWWMVLGSAIDTERQTLSDAQARNAQLQTEIDELQRFALLEAEVQVKEGALQTVMNGDINWSSMLTQISMVIPGEVWLDSLNASAGTTEGASQVGTEGAPIRISDETPTGRIQFSGQATAMPAVAEWLIQLGKVDAFSAIWLNSATGSSGDNPTSSTFTFDSTLELGQDALSQRYQGGIP